MVPNILTSFRIISVLAIVVCFYIQNDFSNFLAAILFVLACLTDFLDGFIARRWGQVSKLGQLLDPIADKLLIVTTVMMLIGFNRIRGINMIPAVIIVIREILISGVREYLASMGKDLPVRTLSKWKTFIQMVSMTLLIVADALHGSCLQTVYSIGVISLWFAAFITAISGIHYLSAGLSYILSKKGL